MAEPQMVSVADGQRALRYDIVSPLPARLDLLLAGLRNFTTTAVPIAGWRQACGEGEHEKVEWVRGLYSGLELSLAVCRFCQAVEVHDVSFDLQPGMRSGANKPRRRRRLLGWYAGRRPAGRSFF